MNNLKIIQKLNIIFKHPSGIEYTNDDYNNAIQSPITIDELFKLHNLETNIKYFILSMPKTGNYYIYSGIKTICNDVCIFHSIIEYLYIDIRFINFKIKDIIEYIASKTTYDYLYIISSYREPQSRYISRYLWDVFIGNKKENILNNIDIIGINEFKELYNIDYDIIYESINDFNLDLNNYKYDKINGYTIIPYKDKIKFLFTHIGDIDKMLINFFNIDIKDNNFFKNKNELNTKKILFLESIKNDIYEIEKDIINFYNIDFDNIIDS